jgi:transmembrane sensor
LNLTDKLQQLLEKPHWTDEENHLVLEYLESGDGIPELAELLRDRFEGKLQTIVPEDKGAAARILKNIHERINAESELAPVYKMRFVRRWGWVAAVVIGLIGTATYFVIGQHSGHNLNLTPVAIEATDVAPGGNRAMLTLADGSKIILDNAQDGKLAKQGNVQISKVRSGEITYNSLGERPTGSAFNTVATPRGGQFMIDLPDGTKVWLNAASSIRYPTVFTGTERDVEITGEAYFEVARNIVKPFHVSVNAMGVTVLGTHFNIMAYSEESSIKTTLLEGSVKVTKGSETVLLKPGQQAVLSNQNGALAINPADAEEAIAWKSGRFEFNGSIQSIMRQIERWYDIEVVYEGNVASKSFGGAISRKKNVSEVLKLLELTGSIHFKIEGRKITVIAGK